METDPFGTSMKIVLISLVFKQNLVEPVWIGSVIWYQMGPLNEGDPMLNCTVPV